MVNLSNDEKMSNLHKINILNDRLPVDDAKIS